MRRKSRGQWLSWTWGELADLVARAASEPWAGSSPGLRADDELLLLGGPAQSGLPSSVTRAWIEIGFVLALAEQHGNELVDLREHRPDVVAASAVVFERWYEDALSRLRRQRGFSRRLGVLVQGSQGDAGLFERWALGRLRAALGLARTRVLWCTEGTPSASASSFYRRLGLAVWPAGPAEAASEEDRASLSAARGEAGSERLVSRSLAAS